MGKFVQRGTPQLYIAPSGANTGNRHVRSSRVDTFTLVTFGRLTLLSPNGEESESLAKRRLKLALLAVLATARRPVSRATLAEMFWGGEEESRARHSLSDALSHLRRELGRSAITAHDGDVALSPDAPLVMDAAMFVDALAARDLPRAETLYAGAFLDGVEIEAAPSFEQWVTRERRRLETAFLQVCSQQCLAYARARDWDRCASLSARWLEAAPLSVDAALFRLNAVKAPGTREAARRALEEFDQLTVRLQRDYELVPERPVLELAESLRANMISLPAEAIVSAPSSAPTPAPASPEIDHAVAAPNEMATPEAAVATPARPSTRRSALGRRLMRVATVGGAVIALGAAIAARARTAEGTSPEPVRPRIAIAVELATPDSTTHRLADGLPQMIASELARSPELEVLPPAQLSALLRRRGDSANASQDVTELAELARRVGATLLVTGSIGRDQQALVLDLTVRDARTGRLLRSDALSRPDAAALANEAAARVLTAVVAQRPGLRVADLEPSSVEAYQHFERSMAAFQEGRAQEADQELDLAVALDSSFLAAVQVRLNRAIVNNDTLATRRLRDLLRRSGDHSSQFDRIQTSAYDALAASEWERSEAIARQLVRRYPRDPRAYLVLSGVLATRGRFDAAEEMWKNLLANDSLVVKAGSGPCAPCLVYENLARAQEQQGKWAEAEHSLRKWIELQPNGAASWGSLAVMLAFRQRYDEAVNAAHRSVSFAGNDPAALDMLVRVLVMSRRYDAADSLLTALEKSGSAALKSTVYDVRILLLRERGQFRASEAAIARAEGGVPNAGVQTILMHGANLGRFGEYAAAALLYERSAHGPRLETGPFPKLGAGARGFCWHHALLADAIAPSGDTARLRGIADTLAIGCATSSYGRDRVLHHHVRGLLAMQQRRWSDAESELQQARWGVAEAWTRTNVALARTELALDRAPAAVAALRDAYAAQLEGMGRYQPRSEVDYLMAQAFRKAGERDSAAVYERYVRTAWQNADPDVKRLLAGLQSTEEGQALAAR
jgi:DNA-binding SARP family transcriptional activator/Flp pilus assembly protein TadD/TolB-like protein